MSRAGCRNVPFLYVTDRVTCDMSASLEQVSSNKCFDGILTKYKFKSTALGDLEAAFNLYLPSSARNNHRAPILVYLAGLTCTEDTGAQKGGFLRDASANSLALLFPDTSPRGANIEGEEESWDFGTGAGFYLDATHPKYHKNYNMLSYITVELPKVLEEANIPVDWSRKSIFGHSMGGHGALTIYLQSLHTKNPFMSASAFAPIANAVEAPWGKKAFEKYLKGGIGEAKERYDATELVSKAAGPLKILIHSGTADQFYSQKQLLPENFIKAASSNRHAEDDVTVNLVDGYDHSYYFISTFGPEHVKFHARYLNAST